MGSLMFSCWNESKNVAVAKTVSAARDNLHEIGCDRIEPNYDGLLVHAKCNLSNFKSFKQGFPGLVRFSDADLMGIRLEQNVEVTVFSIEYDA